MGKINTVHVVGLGALGMLFGNDLMQGEDVDVRFVMDADRLAHHATDAYAINGEPVGFKLLAADDATPADLVILAVKYADLDAALTTAAASVGPRTVLVSLLNGITSEKIVSSRYPNNPVVHTVAQGMDAMRDGSQLTYTVHGALHVGVPAGATDADREALSALDELFCRCGLPHVVEDDIAYRMWFKFMLNVGVNQVCMVFDATYAQALAQGSLERAILVAAMREVQAVAAAEGITLAEADLAQCIALEAALDPAGFPSMEQDRRAGRASEVDMFAGVVCELGRVHGILTPANDWLLAQVRQIESAYETR